MRQRTNGRKTTKGRRTQVIKVPEFVIKIVDGKKKKVRTKNWKPGKTKFIFHKPKA